VTDGYRMAALEPETLERVAAYIADIAHVASGPQGSLVSIILFGSGSTGGYAEGSSDLDLLLVLDEETSAAEKQRISQAVGELEARRGFVKPRASGNRFSRLVGTFAARITANVRTYFICTRADLLSGDPGRILGLPSTQTVFVDRIAVPSIVGSGRTLWGEDLLAHVALPPIRRMDVGKAFFGLFSQMLFVMAVYPVLPDATRYAMDILKRSVHSCHFCHHGRAASLADEVSYFESRYGDDRALNRLLSLRRDYCASFLFCLHSLGAIVRLHYRTARDIQFSSRTHVNAGRPEMSCTTGDHGGKCQNPASDTPTSTPGSAPAPGGPRGPDIGAAK
jgi:hypothetical protein